MSSKSYEIDYMCQPGYLHAIVTGINSTANFLQYTTDVLEESQRTERRYVLIEDRLEGPRMSEIEVFSVVIEASQEAAGHYAALAFVDERIGDLRYFAETVAVNRGIPIAVFDNVGDAENWLLSQERSNGNE